MGRCECEPWSAEPRMLCTKQAAGGILESKSFANEGAPRASLALLLYNAYGYALVV